LRLPPVASHRVAPKVVNVCRPADSVLRGAGVPRFLLRCGRHAAVRTDYQRATSDCVSLASRLRQPVGAPLKHCGGHCAHLLCFHCRPDVRLARSSHATRGSIAIHHVLWRHLASPFSALRLPVAAAPLDGGADAHDGSVAVAAAATPAVPRPPLIITSRHHRHCATGECRIRAPARYTQLDKSTVDGGSRRGTVTTLPEVVT